MSFDGSALSQSTLLAHFLFHVPELFPKSPTRPCFIRRQWSRSSLSFLSLPQSQPHVLGTLYKRVSTVSSFLEAGVSAREAEVAETVRFWD